MFVETLIFEFSDANSSNYFFRLYIVWTLWSFAVPQALSIRRDDPYVLVARARTYARMGIVKESLDDVNTVLKEDPDNHQVFCTVGAAANE